MKMASLWKHRLLASFWEAPPLAFSLLHKNPLADRREYTSKQFVLPQCEPPCLAVSLHPDRRQKRELQSWGSTVAAPLPLLVLFKWAAGELFPFFRGPQPAEDVCPISLLAPFNNYVCMEPSPPFQGTSLPLGQLQHSSPVSIMEIGLS